MLLPVFDHDRIFSEHTLAGAGGVDENLVEPALKIPAEPFGRLAGYQNISGAEELQVL